MPQNNVAEDYPAVKTCIFTCSQVDKTGDKCSLKVKCASLSLCQENDSFKGQHTNSRFVQGGYVLEVMSTCKSYIVCR